MNQVVVMGVTGCGKSTVGQLLANALDVPFGDGDDFHPPQNIAKMVELIPLTDEDRWPWLAHIGQWFTQQPQGAVVACSALSRRYRDALRAAAPDLTFVHLAAPQAVLEERVRLRAIAEGHFAGPGLLDSQFAALEPLADDERGVTVDVTQTSPAEAVEAALARL
jgi:carbohydrate kinase (thermoresistant glucokinase family)